MMKLNKFLWDNYKETNEGQKVIQLFLKPDLEEIAKKYLKDKLEQDIITFAVKSIIKPLVPKIGSIKQAKLFFDKIINEGFNLKEEEGDFHYKKDESNFIFLLPLISTYLYYNSPNYFKPYLYRNNFLLLTQIADAFEMELPEVPLKRYKEERLMYYWKLNKIFFEFQTLNDMSGPEFCAFLYDFAPKFIQKNQDEEKELPQPTQVWMVGGDKSGGDFQFLDNYKKGTTSFWQGNIDTKKGDIIIMYCLAPRSYIHSIWRATKDGIADPFFTYYSNIYIGDGVKIEPISLNELKEDPYFKNHPLVRKNLQGVSGYPFSSEDYNRILYLIEKKGGKTNGLPKLYSPKISVVSNKLNNERDVELTLIEPFLKELGYSESDWVRQLSVRMGRGERNYPDYAFLSSKEKNYEVASMLIESKYWIKNNKELEETFKQIYSYGLRLSSKILVVADKDAIWIYQKTNDTFDRSKYIKKFWEELKEPDEFSKIKKLIGFKK